MPVEISTNVFSKPYGLIKIVIFFVSLLAWALCASFDCILGFDLDGRGFFLAIHIIIWIYAMAVAALYLFLMPSLLKLPFSWWIFELSFVASFAVLGFISSCVLAADTDKKFADAACDNLDEAKAAVAFGFLVFVLMCVQAFFLFQEAKASGFSCNSGESSMETRETRTEQTSADGTTTTVVVQKETTSSSSKNIPF